jgi:hypothetical protein
MSDLYKHYPGLVLHETYICFIFDVFKVIILKNTPVDYDDVFTLYCNAKEFVNTHSDCSEYLNDVLDMAKDIIEELNLGSIGSHEMQKLSKWRSNILKVIDTPKTQILNRRFELNQVLDYRRILEIKGINNIVTELSKKPPEEISKIYPQISSEAMQRIVYNTSKVDDYDRYFIDKYNLILFKAAFFSKGSDELCERILKCEGLSSIKRLYENMIELLTENNESDIRKNEVREIIKEAVANEFRNYRLTGLQYKDYQEVEEFVKDTLGLYYMNQNDINVNPVEQKKGIRFPFGKK